MFITSVRAWELEERRKQTGEKEDKYIKDESKNRVLYTFPEDFYITHLFPFTSSCSDV